MSQVDIVVPCYNYGRFLRDCVKSILTQEVVEIRVLIIDDCSQDDTEDVGRQLASEDPRVEFRRHESNRGHIATFNEGLMEWASGDYCMLLSADDMLTSGALRRAMGLMDLYPDVGMTYGKVIMSASPKWERSHATVDYSSRVLSGLDFLRSTCLEGLNIVPTPTAVLRTSLQKRIGGYNHDLPHTGDLEMWLRCGASGAIGFIDTYQAFYRTHGQNMSINFSEITAVSQLKDAFNTFFMNYANLLPDHEELHELANRKVAELAFWNAREMYNRNEWSKYREYLEARAGNIPGHSIHTHLAPIRSQASDRLQVLGYDQTPCPTLSSPDKHGREVSWVIVVNIRPCGS